MSTTKAIMRPAPSPLQHPAMKPDSGSTTSSRRSRASVSSVASSAWKRSVSFLAETPAHETPEDRAERKRRTAEAYSLSNPGFWNTVFRT